MQIRFVSSWRRYIPDDIADLGDPINDVLVRRGVAEWHAPKPRREKAVRKRGENAALHLEHTR